MTEVEKAQRVRRGMERVTMMDVARHSGVSASSVSLFLRKPEAVSAKIAPRIAAAIEKLGYVPNYVAGGLAAAGSRVVSVIVPSLRNAFFSETVSALEKNLSRNGLQTLVGHTEYSLEQEERLVRAALSWAPAAIVLTGNDHTDGTRNLLLKTATPVVEMWELPDAPIDCAVGFPHEEVGRAMARHFIARGYENVAFLGARLDEDTRAASRARGFMEEMREAGCKAQLISDPAPASTATGARMLDAIGNDVRAVACSNDIVALGVLFEAQKRDLTIPDRLAVAGFGDLDFAANCVPPLTTIRPQAEQIAETVANCILNRESEQRSYRTDFALIPRRSA
jgi:LacI family gluconate utilization system Gnt-I transcriptional repressor